jgi:secondary thiamine-phosphate synthase enzyme
METIQDITVKSGSRSQFIDITHQVAEAIQKSGARGGLCLVACPHTTAAVTINENADPTVQSDILEQLDRMVCSAPGRLYFSVSSTDPGVDG